MFRVPIKLAFLVTLSTLILASRSTAAEPASSDENIPVIFERIVIANAGAEHFKNAVFCRGSNGNYIASWGDKRVVKWPVGESSATIETYPAEAGYAEYCNGGCSMDVNGDGNDNAITERKIRGKNKGGQLVWFEEIPDQSKWQLHEIANLKYASYGPHDVTPLEATVDLEKTIRGVVVVNERKSLLWYEMPEDPTQPWKEHNIGSFDTNNKQSSIAVGDIAGHGLPDVVCGMYWAECPADPTSDAWKIRRYGKLDEGGSHPGWGGMAKTALGDMNGDGQMDIIVSEAEIPDARLAIFTRDAANPDALWECKIVDEGLYAPHSVVVLDADQDGKLDLIVGEMTAGGWDFPMNPEPKVYLYLNKGNLEFQKYVVDKGFGVHEMRLAHVQIDGKPFIFASDEIQLHKFKDMQTHVIGWTISPKQ